MNALEPLAHGRHAELYALDDGHILKLFHRGYAAGAIQAELKLARSAHEAGIPTPRAERIIETRGRSGIVFERCEGPTLLQHIVTRSAPAERLAEVFFGLQRAVHASAPQFPDLKERLAAKIARAQRAPAALRALALERLARLPAGTAACHGDFHPANVIMSPKGPMIVDWQDAGRADAALDASRSLLLLRYARPGQIDDDLRAAFVAAYAARLREAWGGNMEALERWQLPLAVARLAEGAEEAECEKLLQLASTTLSASPS
jgi:Ser/Thr protein kinase RdoA (MazF antagonist)